MILRIMNGRRTPREAVVTMTTVRKRARRLGAAALAALVLATRVIIGTTQAQEPRILSPPYPEAPKLVWFSVSGLDQDHNKLDAILGISGRWCIHGKREDLDKPGECIVERSLTDFLRKLPPDQRAIARELQSLGAKCRTIRRWLTCIYRAREDYKSLEGAVLLLDEDISFTVQFNVVNRNGQLNYSTLVERKLAVVYEKKDRFSNPR